ncbi:hypothetical protein [Thalassospira alkalitolerans]|uniref:hypothetical protein n=1 Tax=Thalassospira alkalitolerans TaxID=1293890 RepID=UPI003AA9342F
MPIYSGTIRSIYFDHNPYQDYGCEVKIENQSIEVCYRDNDSTPFLSYFGEEKSKGHYVLHSQNRNGTATLHCFENSNKLEGYWNENGTEGMWRITLNEEQTQ